MMRARRSRSLAAAATVLSVIAACSWSPPVVAEVAVAISTHDGAGEPLPFPYVLAGLTDAGDPLGAAVWTPYNTASPGRVLLNPEGAVNGDGAPSIGRDLVDGAPIVVWSKHSPAGHDVVLSRFAGGDWTDPVTLAGAAGDELDPQLVIDTSGAALYLVYWIDDADPRVMVRRGNADGSAWEAPIRVSRTDEAAMRPSAVVHAGTLQVVYESHAPGAPATPRQIVVAGETPGGFDGAILTTTHYEQASWPQIHGSASKLWVEWIDAEGEMTWTQRLADGSWQGVQAEPFDTVEDREFHVRGRIKAAVRSLGD
jgi:hypothetical protein